MHRYYTGVGSRSTPVEVLHRMTLIAKEKAKLGYILRSGGADGADTAFEKGAGEFTEIWLPWIGFNGHHSRLVPSAQAIALVPKFHSRGAWLSSTLRLLHARNIHQVLGADLSTPSEELICWTPSGLTIGGTATAIRVAQAHGIKVINLGEGE